jgi:hypothetical protein
LFWPLCRMNCDGVGRQSASKKYENIDSSPRIHCVSSYHLHSSLTHLGLAGALHRLPAGKLRVVALHHGPVESPADAFAQVKRRLGALCSGYPRQPAPMVAPTIFCIGSLPCWHSPQSVWFLVLEISRRVRLSSSVTRIARSCTGVPGGMGPRLDRSSVQVFTSVISASMSNRPSSRW